MSIEKGLSIDTNYSLTPAPAPADHVKLTDNIDPRWAGYTLPWHPDSLGKFATHLQIFVPVGGTAHPSM